MDLEGDGLKQGSSAAAQAPVFMGCCTTTSARNRAEKEDATRPEACAFALSGRKADTKWREWLLCGMA